MGLRLRSIIPDDKSIKRKRTGQNSNKRSYPKFQRILRTKTKCLSQLREIFLDKTDGNRNTRRLQAEIDRDRNRMCVRRSNSQKIYDRNYGYKTPRKINERKEATTAGRY